MAQRVIGFVRAILFCRWLDPDQLGLWDMAWGFLMLAAPLAVLSLPGTFGAVEHFRQRACCGLPAPHRAALRRAGRIASARSSAGGRSRS